MGGTTNDPGKGATAVIDGAHPVSGFRNLRPTVPVTGGPITGGPITGDPKSRSPNPVEMSLIVDVWIVDDR